MSVIVCVFHSVSVHFWIIDSRCLCVDSDDWIRHQLSTAVFEQVDMKSRKTAVHNYTHTLNLCECPDCANPLSLLSLMCLLSSRFSIIIIRAAEEKSELLFVIIGTLRIKGIMSKKKTEWLKEKKQLQCVCDVLVIFTVIAFWPFFPFLSLSLSKHKCSEKGNMHSDCSHVEVLQNCLWLSVWVQSMEWLLIDVCLSWKSAQASVLGKPGPRVRFQPEGKSWPLGAVIWCCAW